MPEGSSFRLASSQPSQKASRAVIITSKPYRILDVEIILSFDSTKALSPSDVVSESEAVRIKKWLDEAVQEVGKIYIHSGYGP